ILCCAALATTATGLAQTTVPTGGYALRRGGEREFTLGGSGASNRDFDSSFGGVSASLGWYSDENQGWFIRQSVNYSNPEDTGSDWFGSTRLAYDYHFPLGGSMRPFIGANIEIGRAHV